MNIRKILSVAVIVFGFAVSAQAQIVSQAHEVMLSDLRTPSSASGTVAFRACDECEHTVVRVTASTRYSINGKVVRFADFSKAVATASNRDDVAALVLHHLESDTVEAIDVSL
ncbi:MAG: hypothetical protein AAF351_05980 [Pseudomonadota bacterium]